MLEVLCALLLLATGSVSEGAVVEGRLAVWHPITLTFQGPEAAEPDNSPNPFFDVRFQVVFLGPSKQRFVVPGFFDGDGRSGPKGRVWHVHFSPEAPEPGGMRLRSERDPAWPSNLNPTPGNHSRCPVSPARSSCLHATPTRRAF